MRNKSKSITQISIHALRGEGDVSDLTEDEINALFQSTPSVGRATRIAQSQNR